MNNRLPWDITAADADADADGGKTARATRAQAARYLIVAMLLGAAALDLTRCGLVMTTARQPAPTAGLVAAGLAAAGLTARTRPRMPGRPALGSIAHRRSVSPASGRVRLPQALYDPRHGYHCPGDAAGHHYPGHRGPDGPPGHGTAIPSVLDREATRCPGGQHTIIDLSGAGPLGHQVADFVLHHLRSAPAGAC